MAWALVVSIGGVYVRVVSRGVGQSCSTQISRWTIFRSVSSFVRSSRGYEDVRRVFLLVERTRLCCCCCDRCEVFARRAGRALRTAGRALRPAGRAFEAVVRVFLAAVRTFAALARVLRPAGRAFWRGVRTFRGFALLGLPMTI